MVVTMRPAQATSIQTQYCPYCLVQPGEPCTTRTGKRAHAPHVLRHDRWWFKLVREGPLDILVPAEYERPAPMLMDFDQYTDPDTDPDIDPDKLKGSM